MNHRMLFFLSIIMIAVGLVGIVTQRESSPETESKQNTEIGAKREKGSKVIVVAEALHDLEPRSILNRDDYSIRTIEIPEDKSDARDLSSLPTKDLTGFLLLNKVNKNSAIFSDMVISPDNKDFLLRSLSREQSPYAYSVNPENAYLLSSLKVGDLVSIYIRLIEVDKNKMSQIDLVPEGGRGPDKEMQKYTLVKVFGPLSVLQINSKNEKTSSMGGYSRESVGTILLRVDVKQMAELRVIEKAGEVLLFPSSDAEGGYDKIRMDEVLPQFQSVKELRGKK